MISLLILASSHGVVVLVHRIGYGVSVLDNDSSIGNFLS